MAASTIADAYVAVKPDMTKFAPTVVKELENTGKAAGDAFTRGSDGRLRDAHGRFVKAGTDLGSAAAKGVGDAGRQAGEKFSTDANGRLRDSSGRFVKTAGDVGDHAAKAVGDKGGTAGKNFGDGLHRSVPHVQGFASRVTGIFAALGATLTIGAGINFFKSAIDEAREAERVTKLTEAVIKSTGGAAQVTGAQVAQYANKLSALAGVDDEVIQDGQNMLLTFTNVQNRVGAGNDVFNQATAAALNMSAAMGKDMHSSAIAVGKALNDPIAGVTALRRVGVQLTDQQQEQVKGFMAAGDVMSAQKLILAELSKEFGGAAEAAANPADKARVAWENMKETLATALLPVLDKVAGFISGTVAPAVSALIAGLQGDYDDTSGIIGFFNDAGMAIHDFVKGLQGIATDPAGIAGALNDFGMGLRGIGTDADGAGGFLNGLGKAINTVGTFLVNHKDVIMVFAKSLLAVLVAVKLVTTATAIFNAVLYANPIVWIIALVAGFIAIWVLAYQKIDWFRQAVQTWFGLIGDAAMWLWNEAIKPAFNAIKDFVVNTLAPALVWLWDNVIKPTWEAISAIISWAWENVIQPVFQAVKRGIEDLAPVFEFLAGVARFVWSVISTAVEVAWAVIQIIFHTIKWWVENVVAPVFSWLWKNVIEPVWNGISAVITTVWNNYIKPILEAVGNFIKEKVAPAFETGVAAIKTAWDKVIDIAKVPVRFVIETVINKGIIDTINKVSGIFGISPISHVPVPFARGGVYPGYTPGRDVGLAAVSGGEAIMRPEWTRAVGHNYVNDANAAARSGGVGGVRKFLGAYADGGVVGQSSRTGGIIDTIAGGLTSFFSDPAGTLRNAVNTLLDNLPGGGLFKEIMKKMPLKLVDQAIKWIQDKISSLFGSGDHRGPLGGALDSIIALGRKSGIPFSVSSGQRDTPDYHGTGNAADLVSSNMVGLAQYFYKFSSYLLELIHSGGAGYFVKDGQVKPRGWYGAATEAGHYDHVHVAATKRAMDSALGAAMFGGGATAGGSLGAWIQAAIAFTGVGSSWAGPLYTLIMRESGGNPMAINNWDSNAAMGDPSRGLMQTIGATFNQYRDPRLSANIYDPIANIVAGIRYILARYGTIFNVQQAVGATPMGYASGGTIPFGVYDSGGFLPTGYSLAFNGTGAPEPVGHGLGARNYTVNVNVPPNANMAEVGRVTVEAIKAFEQKNTNRWRT